MNEQDKVYCRNCHFYEPDKGPMPSTQVRDGDCRIGAPDPTADSWARVTDNGWCGDGIRKSTLTKEESDNNG